ncbi:MAG: tetratricopeptide repeat protein [Cyclobacteriaceae bacterium]|nr:tetratricopeptide repeat protein [Cyclobacteriaceae bacterium]
MVQIEWIEKYLTEAEQMMYNNQVKEGLELLDSLLYDEPGYGSLHNHIGWAYLYYTSDTNRAELHLTMAIRFEELFAPPYLHLGVLYIRLGRYKDAITFLERGLSKHQPNRVALLQHIAQAYELLGEWGQAIKAYKAAMLASVVEHEIDSLTANIKRCRKKRVMLFLSGNKERSYKSV